MSLSNSGQGAESNSVQGLQKYHRLSIARFSGDCPEAALLAVSLKVKPLLSDGVLH